MNEPGENIRNQIISLEGAERGIGQASIELFHFTEERNEEIVFLQIPTS